MMKTPNRNTPYRSTHLLRTPPPSSGRRGKTSLVLPRSSTVPGRSPLYLMRNTPQSTSRKSKVPKLTYSPLVTRKTPGRRRGTPTVCSSADRFIPNRSYINVDLCRSSFLSAERRRKEKKSETPSTPGENGNPNSSSPSTSQTDPETALQTEFRRRMKGALLDIPLGDISRNQENETRLLSFFEGTRGGSSKSVGSEVTLDPYSHDQLRVLQRSASKSGLGTNTYTSDADPLDFGLNSTAHKVRRKIPNAPTRILDAPDIVDDFYINLLSWSKDNILAVALGQCVYLWDANTGDIQHLVTLRGSDDYVTSVSWATIPGHTKYIAVGTNSSTVQLWDTHALKKIRTMNGHSNRVSALSWNSHWLTSGGRDSLILQHDVRSANHVVSTYRGHTQEVCGLKWNEEGTTLASGGNENYLCIWDAAMSRRDASNRAGRHCVEPEVSPRILLTQHKAAVKALAWCPFRRGLLASGGGTADRTIKFWNTTKGTMLNSVDTGSQVCSLLWSNHQHELCSSHGFSENQLILWKYPTMTKIQEFKGHTSRVLHTEQSPDGGCVVSAAADETLRFWDVFGAPPRKPTSNGLLTLGDFPGGIGTIR